GSESQTRPVTRRQQLRLIGCPASPDRPDGVNYMPGSQIISSGHLGLAGFASAQQSAFLQKFGSRGPMNRSVHASAAEQRAVGRVDDGVNVELGDVACDYFYSRIHGRSYFRIGIQQELYFERSDP